MGGGSGAGARGAWRERGPCAPCGRPPNVDAPREPLRRDLVAVALPGRAGRPGGGARLGAGALSGAPVLPTLPRRRLVSCGPRGPRPAAARSPHRPAPGRTPAGGQPVRDKAKLTAVSASAMLPDKTKGKKIKTKYIRIPVPSSCACSRVVPGLLFRYRPANRARCPLARVDPCLHVIAPHCYLEKWTVCVGAFASSVGSGRVRAREVQPSAGCFGACSLMHCSWPHSAGLTRWVPDENRRNSGAFRPVIWRDCVEHYVFCCRMA